jgi:hypothetical protein
MKSKKSCEMKGKKKTDAIIDTKTSTVITTTTTTTVTTTTTTVTTTPAAEIASDVECLMILRRYKMKNLSTTFADKFFQYKILITKANQIKNRYTKYKKRHSHMPNKKKILEIYSFSVADLWNKCVITLGKLTHVDGTYFNLQHGLSEKKFMKIVNDCNNKHLKEL